MKTPTLQTFLRKTFSMRPTIQNRKKSLKKISSMEPQNYLTKDGKQIFKQIVAAIPNKDILLKTDSLELSMLAQAFDVYARGAKELNAETEIKTTKAQLSTIIKQSSDFITKNSDKFGLNPAARGKIQAFAMRKKEKKKGVLKTLQGQG